MIVLPIDFGLAIVAEQQQLASRPQLAEALDRLESSEGRGELLELAESLRIDALIRREKTALRGQRALDRSARRYLEVVKSALLNDHHIENEVRLEYLEENLELGRHVDAVTLRDPARWRRTPLLDLREARQTGTPLGELSDGPHFPFTHVGRSGLDQLQRVMETVRRDGVEGDLAACGVWRGGSAIFLRAVLEAYEIEGPRVWVADSFRGPPEPAGDAGAELLADEHPNLVGELNVVRDGFARFGLLDERVRFLQGSFDDTLAEAATGELALVHIDAELHDATAAALEHLYARIARGGAVVIAAL